jgi:glycine cleavage system H protein
MSQQKKLLKERNVTPDKLTRRQFLRDAGLVIGGAALTQVAFAAACGAPQATTLPTGTITPTTSVTTPPTTGSTTTPTNTTPGTTTPLASGDVYIPPSGRPPLTMTPGCTTYVAFDRLYSIEHVWVKEQGNNRAVIGITDKMQALMDTVTKVELPKIGEIIAGGISFGFTEGFKMAVDLISPVSGKVLQTNANLKSNMALLNTDPFVNGWMVYLELTKPGEIKDLISPQEYMMLQAKAVTTPAT